MRFAAHVLSAVGVLLSLLPCAAQNPSLDLTSWKHSGALTILTTPEGANLPAGTVLEGFPLLVRLHRDWFDFQQAASGGDDVRFSNAQGAPLAHQVETWDAENGTASIWVRVPRVEGNTRQALRMHWGKPGAASESNGAAVFNESNGYLSVWHLGDAARDEVGTLESKDVNTTVTPGVIGSARHFAGKQGIFCGDKISNYPVADGPHSTSAWFRAARPNATIIGWGNEGGGRGSKVRMQFRSPPHLRIDSDFSDVKGERRLTIGEWIHVTHTYQSGEGKIYINGALDGAAKPKLDIKTPARLWLGGWYHNYDFVGDLDEARISKVTRSAEWVRLEYENQKPLQTAVGLLVQPGNAFAVTPAAVNLLEGKSATITAQAGGAQKVIWTLQRDGRESVVAVDRLSFTLDAGRVTSDTAASLKCTAIYPTTIKTRAIPVTIREDIAEPAFTLMAPATWDGRTTIEVVPKMANLAAMQANGAGEVKIEWSVAPLAVIKEASAEKLILKRAQNSGQLTITAIASNGGQSVSKAVTLSVTEPPRDTWVPRQPAADEKPVDGQFYAREDKGEGKLFYRGALTEPAEEVFLKVFAGDQPYRSESSKPGPDRAYAFAVKLKPGLIKYRVEFGTRSGGADTVLHSASDLVCGDVYLINGQSNAEATAWGKEDFLYTNEWIRSYGSAESGAPGARTKLWGKAEARAKGGRLQIGYWGMELARRLVENHKVPICILNGAVGGTRIDQHQRNHADPVDVNTIYGRLLWRAQQAGLTHGIRGVLWHQGENDQGADGPTGGFGWETYRQYFIDLAAAWKQDFPNIQHYYVFQIWPKSCAMGINGSDNRLREVQRSLPTAFSNLSLMSTLGIEPPGGCHYPPAGYAEIARLICPLVERDHYGKNFATPITPPNLERAVFSNFAKDEIALEFDQPIKWDDSLSGQFYLDGEKGKIASGSAMANVLRLKLREPSDTKTITYLDSAAWSQKTLLRGDNGIAALTFCEVPLVKTNAGNANPQ